MGVASLTEGWVSGNPQIGYDEIGSGPPLIFLHGIGGNRTNWIDQQLSMADICTTISWDARGYGKSEDHDGALNFSDFSGDLVRLLTSCDINKAHFVGLSMGARILMDFFSIAPDRVATLTLCDCFYSFQGALSPKKQAEFIALRQEPLKQGKSLEDIAPDLINSLVGPNCSEDVKVKLYKSIADLHVESYLKTIAASMTFDVSSRLAEFDVPVQLIYGEHDKLTPPSIGNDMMNQMPRARMQIIEEAGHLSNMEQPDAFNNTLRLFINEHLTLASFKNNQSV
ncbi:MAG: alpha/beta fold hydrolase [Burkholderiales bacterium]|jgi:3-oxoadipate enol-lactonase